MRKPVNKRKETVIKRKNKEEGLAFIEVLVTTVILAMVLIAILSCFLYGFG